MLTMQIVIRNIGNSKGVVIPKRFLDAINADAGDALEMTVDNGRFLMTPVKTKPKYKLADLLKKCDENAPMPDVLNEWDNAQPVGNEI